jgi:hypothetical protein
MYWYHTQAKLQTTSSESPPHKLTCPLYKSIREVRLKVRIPEARRGTSEVGSLDSGPRSISHALPRDEGLLAALAGLVDQLVVYGPVADVSDSGAGSRARRQHSTRFATHKKG